MSLRFHRGSSIVTLFHDPKSRASRDALQLLRRTAGRTVAVDESQGGVLASIAAGAKGAGTSPSLTDEQRSSGATVPGEEYATEYLQRLANEPVDQTEFGDFELQVQDRRSQPPTDSQMKSILQYLRQTPVPPPLPKVSDEPDESAVELEDGSYGADASRSGGGSVKNAATLRKVKEMQLKMKEARERAEKEKQAAILGAEIKVDQLPRPPITSAVEPEPEASPAVEPTPAPHAEEVPRSHLYDHLSTPSNAAGAPSIREGPLAVWWDEGYAATSLEGVHAMLEKMKQVNTSNDPKGGSSCSVM